jgi:hypothetical protein
MRRRTWRNWADGGGQMPEIKKKKPVSEFGYTPLEDGPVRSKRADQIIVNRANLQEAARRLRNTGEGFCLHAALLVDCAIEALDLGLRNLVKDKPRRSPIDPE